MKREILFKAKRVDNGEWVEGFYSPVNLPMVGNMGHFINEKGFKAIEIDPKTVCQFTGLTDKDDNKIFENDKIIDAWGNECVVEFADGCFWVCEVEKESVTPLYVNCDSNNEIECQIIGSIYDSIKEVHGE